MGEKYYSDPIQLEIGTNGHTTMVSCKIAEVGKYHMIIPFGWLHQESTIENIETSENCCFEHAKCVEHGQDEGIADMFEWDEMVAFDEEATMIGRIGSTRQEEVELAGLPKRDWQYKELFENEKAEMLALRRMFEHAIDLEDGPTAPWGPMYPMSAYQLEELNENLHKMLAEGGMVHSKYPAGAPILFVPTPDGRLQLWVDYRKRNKLTILNKYPLLLMTELSERVAGATIFTKLDLKDGYDLIPIKKRDEWKNTFHTRYGDCECKVMQFGLVNAPATFHAMMNTILQEFLHHGVLVYLDDILIY